MAAKKSVILRCHTENVFILLACFKVIKLLCQCGHFAYQTLFKLVLIQFRAFQNELGQVWVMCVQ